jgi:hypothetical protein
VVTLRNIPVDTHRLSFLFCTSLPEARTEPDTGEVRVDRHTGQPLYLVGIAVKVEGERAAYVLDVQVPGEPTGLVVGQPVVVEGLEASPWECEGRSGAIYRATAIKADAQAVTPTPPVPSKPAGPGKAGSRTGRTRPQVNGGS